MAKQKSFTNLLVVPLIASAIFLSTPSLGTAEGRVRGGTIRHTTSMPYAKTGVPGVVISISGTIIRVRGEDGVLYTVDASHATIMKVGVADGNPSLVDVTDIKVGDTIMVRGSIDQSAID